MKFCVGSRLCTVIKNGLNEPVRTSFEGFVRVLFRPIAFATSDYEMDLDLAAVKPYQNSGEYLSLNHVE